jgi:hypothetical protein
MSAVEADAFMGEAESRSKGGSNLRRLKKAETSRS